MLDTVNRQEHYDESAQSAHASCDKPFFLRDLKRGEPDKLGNRVEEICWLGSQYAIYRSERGVYLHFSDCKEEEEKQRCKFTEICPELCELRYLTSQMRSRFSFSLKTRADRGDDLSHTTWRRH